MKLRTVIRLRHAAFGAIASLLVGLGAGCQLMGPDQERMDDADFWNNADIKVEPWGSCTRVQVDSGERTVLMTSEGWSHGKRSSAHASHWAFYCTLPADVREGATYAVSREAGTLLLDAFAGYDPWYLDASHPAEGTVRIQSVRPKKIVAEVDIKATAVCDSGGTPEVERRRRELARAGVFTFGREKRPPRDQTDAVQP